MHIEDDASLSSSPVAKAGESTMRCASLALALTLLSPTAALSQSTIPPEFRGSEQAVARGIVDGNLIETNYRNHGEFSRWNDNPHGVWPQDGGGHHVDGIGFVAAGLVRGERAKWSHLVPEWQGLEDTLLNPVIINYKDAGRKEGVDGRVWGWLPLALDGFPSYHNPFRIGSSGARVPQPAISDDPSTWPAYWPDRLNESDPGWPAMWNGAGGKNIYVADLESYYVMSDDSDMEYGIDTTLNLPFSKSGVYIPDPTDSTRGGLGLVVEVRIFQWMHQLAQDLMFITHRVTNVGQTDHGNQDLPGDSRETGLWFATVLDFGLGYEEGDDLSGFDPQRDLVYGFDSDGIGVKPTGGDYNLGYTGVALLETGGNAFDGIDNDEDGILDERPDSGPGMMIQGTDQILAYVAANYDVSALTGRYGPPENRPAVVAGTWWTGDEDLDWVSANDLGMDGVGPDDVRHNGPDAGEGDGVPSSGEPNIDRQDLDESDQIGLTGYHLASRPVFENRDNMRDDSWLWARIVESEFPLGEPPTVLIGDVEPMIIAATGPYDLPPATSTQLGMGWIFGADEADFFANRRNAERIAVAGYRWAQAPALPTIEAIATEGGILVTWDDISLGTFDAFSKTYDFEGFKLYRATNSTAATLVGTWDLANGVSGSVPLEDGGEFDLGADTGLESIEVLDPQGNRLGFAYLDSDVTPGDTYAYGIIAYDHGTLSEEGVISPLANPIELLFDANGNVVASSRNATSVSFGVDAKEELPPHVFSLGPGYPSPFSVSTTIPFSLSEPGDVELSVHDLLGRHVATIVKGTLPAGVHEAVWNAVGMPSGIYFCRLRAGNQIESSSLVIVR